MGHWVTYMPHYFLEMKWLVIHSLSFRTYSSHSTHCVNRIKPSKCLRAKQNTISSI
uniref:Uncharacterized protein n=1 Tax=Arundo donax TaxID=35708 RepID=A0A0A9IM43_ARUDO